LTLGAAGALWGSLSVSEGMEPNFMRRRLGETLNIMCENDEVKNQTKEENHVYIGKMKNQEMSKGESNKSNGSACT
jgi:hypothetical protein